MGLIPTITVWQPWASLIAIGAKPYEFRSWTPPREFRHTRVAIHAGARSVRGDEIRGLIYQLERGETSGNLLVPDVALRLLHQALAMPAVLPTSAVVCTAIMGEPVRCTDLDPAAGDRMWAWPMTEARQFEPPVPARGRQGWWWARLPSQNVEASP